jgi:BirA family biotin operon repressor/biotin-[acetyl-CoA-carboxylase] ligase
MSPEVVDAIGRLEGQSFVREVEWFAELPSTNDYALARGAELALPLPRLIWAERQTAGRGRGDHRWWSSCGALTFSLLIDGPALGLPPASWPQLSMVSAIAVAEALQQFLPEDRIALKWPNDVHILFASGSGGSSAASRGTADSDRQPVSRKICGILVEPVTGVPGRLVIGIGLNVRNSLDSASAKLRKQAASLVELLPEPPTLPLMLCTLVQAWVRAAQDLAAGRMDLVARWSRQCLLREREVRWTLWERTVTGICRGINPQGALLIEREGRLETYWGGTVRLL